MKNHPSRRLFLRNSAIATTGLAFLTSSSFATSFSNNKSPFEGYNPHAEEKTDLRISSIFGKHITIKGKIFNKSGNNTIANSTVEVWHLSPNSNSFRHKAKLTTNQLGEYSFITDFPNREPGKMSRIYFKVSNGNTSYFTELLFNDFGAHITGKHWEENNQLGDKLFPIKEDFLNKKNITFNLTI